LAELPTRELRDPQRRPAFSEKGKSAMSDLRQYGSDPFRLYISLAQLLDAAEATWLWSGIGFPDGKQQECLRQLVGSYDATHRLAEADGAAASTWIVRLLSRVDAVHALAMPILDPRIQPNYGTRGKKRLAKILRVLGRNCAELRNASNLRAVKTTCAHAEGGDGVFEWSEVPSEVVRELFATEKDAKPGGSTVNRKQARLERLAKAMLLVHEHPEWPDAEVARQLGGEKYKSALSRSREYQAAAKLARAPKKTLPKGHVDIDPETGKRRGIEAYDDDDAGETDD
jgi:hypothetical protein